jgi:hypothetical protein
MLFECQRLTRRIWLQQNRLLGSGDRRETALANLERRTSGAPDSGDHVANPRISNGAEAALERGSNEHPCSNCLLRNEWQLHEARAIGCVIDPLDRLAIVLRLRPEDARYERLRIAIVEREPR